MPKSNDSHNLIYEEIKERLKDQMDSITSIDTKAGIVIALIGAFLGGLVNSSWFLELPKLQLILVLTPLVISLTLALVSIKVADYRKDPEPTPLVDKYAEENQEKTQGQLIRNFADSYDKNKRAITKKEWFINASLIMLGVSILFLCITLISRKNYMYKNAPFNYSRRCYDQKFRK